MVVNGSRAIDVQVRGTYAFSIFGTFPINETDAVTIHFADRKTSVTGLFGGGINYDFSARRGIRADVRVLMGPIRCHDRHRRLSARTARGARVRPAVADDAEHSVEDHDRNPDHAQRRRRHSARDVFWQRFRSSHAGDDRLFLQILIMRGHGLDSFRRW